ncbi:MAG: hypothetical protein ACREN7_06635, partial [Candidatus Dormibacteria bacterium]
LVGGPGVGSGRWREAAQRELERARARRAGLERKLAGPFSAKAPAEVVQGARDRVEEVRQREALLRRLTES